jgi:hypothetical protein
MLDWLKERPKNPPGKFKLFSFLSFFSLCVVAAAFSSGSYLWLFGALVLVDGLGTVMQTDSIVSADRAILFLAITILAITKNPSNVFLLTLEILGLIAALDFSFLLRKLDGTGVDVGVIANRLKSYTRTILPAFLLTYLFLYVYSLNLQFNAFEAVVALGLASVGVLITIYAIVRFLLAFDKI